MAMYDQFAFIYDRLMSDIPYAKYVEWVQKEAPISKGNKLVDIGCGTGVLSIEFSKAGYDVVGVDLSESMLTVAHNRSIENNTHISFICQSMTALDGIEDINVAVIAIDSLNYLETLEEVEQTFQHIAHSLVTGGQLFFDIHSLYKMNVIYPNGPFTFEDEHVAYIWNTEIGEEDHSIYHDITFFVQDDQDYYKRFEESHYQRTFPIGTYVDLLKAIGFSSVTVSTNIFGEQKEEEVERIFIHAIK
ncbi:class I SAM-dependent DNA methyltransferase [Psychrobacillus vulpis]|uniref:Class I SAM-dependent methyltransferase n=1 Tax=Psychrobacillus vulpis TaxID=2325572 RepID=A0A544TPB6_9BACI|nr:class I SAM-dependent methyltransferase [Psychrobacillus vulpis]TQR19259.1 class I SAM-dependent methyltransferase [Psychrobacillus vulpis]